MRETVNHSARLDQAGIGMSLLCVLHCTLLPVMAATLPWIGALGVVDDWFHSAILLLVIPVSGWALGRVWQRQGQWLPLVLGIVGMGFMVLAVFEFLAWHSAGLEVAMTLGGGAILCLAHLINLRNFLRPASVTSFMTASDPEA